MRHLRMTTCALAVAIMLMGVVVTAHAQAGKQPNIVVIMGDDIGWFNIGAYHRGIMAGKTPNLDSWPRRA